MKIALVLVALAALCFAAAILIIGTGASSVNRWFLAACVGFLILAGARVLYATLARTR